MLSRADVISLAASVGGILLALQSGGYDSFDINKSWQVNLQSPFQNSLAGSLDRCRRDLAAPIVVDLTGDGHNDVVLSTCEPSIKLISSTSSQDQPFGPEVSYSYKLDSASTDLTPHAIALGTLFGGGDDSSNACESHSLEVRHEAKEHTLRIGPLICLFLPHLFKPETTASPPQQSQSLGPRSKAGESCERFSPVGRSLLC